VTWPRWTGRVSLKDFRLHGYVRPGAFTALDPLGEGGEIKAKNIPDGAKGSLEPSTYANLVGLTRKAIVNDELGAFDNVIAGLGEAASFTIEDAAAALLLQNGGLGPTQADGRPIFDAARNNMGSAGTMSVDTWGEAAALMALQTDVSGSRVLGLEPAVIVVPVGSAMLARKINADSVDPSAPVSGAANAAKGMVRDVVPAPWLGTGKRYYLFARPEVYPTIGIGFINGNEAPMIDTFTPADVDGVKFRVRLDFAAAALDHRGGVTCPGQ
jgi:hypothetical protein